MTWADWSSWEWSIATAGWLFWIAFFIFWETYTGLYHRGEMLTDHLRPLFLSFPVLWWVTLGAALWAIVHLWFPALESVLFDMVRTKP